MKTTIYKIFTLECAHFLPAVPAGHPCARMHGHSFRVTVHLCGPVDPITGWIVDFGRVREAFEPIRCQLDHHTLNEIAGLENPTSENLARFIYHQLKPDLPALCRVEVGETCTAGAIVEA
ncbi:6-pyruvoyl tetrahydrobiopterin synthase [mine drainage metagenome]|uniref:6-pyruvoyl tetrahydrobiopterin synthase n=2 Tax=mine drainage metagenome TaxID=410659 RepID=T1BU79_9ZZZZ